MNEITLKVEDTNLVSDGYHTFGELYEHRINIFIALCNSLSKIDDLEQKGTNFPVYYRAWKSKQHHEGGEPMYDGWFIVGIDIEEGKQISYHMPMKKWELLKCPEVGHAPVWDGHSSDDVINRLLNI